MTDHSQLGPWVRRFLLEHLISVRNLARNTQHSYRDTLCLLLPFMASQAGKPVDQLAVTDLSAERVRQSCWNWNCSVSVGLQRVISAWQRFALSPTLLDSTALSIWNGAPVCAPSLARKLRAQSLLIWKNRKWTP